MKSSSLNIVRDKELKLLQEENERLQKALANNELIDQAQSNAILNSLPVAVWEEDFSEVKQFLDALANKGVTDFDRHFSENPSDVKHCAALIKVISVNEAALKMTGLSAQPDRIDNLPRFFNSDSESVFKNEFVALANGNSSFRSEAVTVDMQAQTMQIIFQVNVVQGHEHDLSRVLVTVTDVTEENSLKKELNRSEVEWRVIFESLADGVMIIDRSLHIVQTNFYSLNAPPGVNPVGKSIIDLVVPEDRLKATEFYTNVFNRGKSGKAEHRSFSAGRETIHNVVASPIKIDGRIEKVVVVARNMTTQRKTERELALSEARWRSIFNYASDLIFIANRDFEVTEANEPAIKIISEKLLGNRLNQILLPENAKVVTDMISKVFNTDTQLQTVIKIPQGEYKGHLYSCDISTLPNPHGDSSVIVIARDITKSKNLEKQVLDALIQGQERERKRVARELHDGLGQLFTALNLNMQLFKLRNSLSLDDQAQEQLAELSNIADKAVLEVKGISKNLLPDALNHHGLVPAIREVINALDGGKTKILFDIVDANKRYPEKIELTIFRALQELLNNAVKYANADTIHVQLVDHVDSLVLTVEDDGNGMDPNNMKTGNGIGNTSARAEALDGAFHIEGALGKGTLAYIEIPLNLVL